ncbi:MAG TPA: B12-binding domain-containing radical SAM protein [bacterium]|nr:B12-binding domain-containing radical SAM protein [bacterium]
MSSILLIYPNPSGMFARMPYPVLYLAGYLRKRGISADIFDLQIERKEDIDFRQYDYFGFSLQFTGPQIRNALEVARFLRKNRVKVPFIWGGTHATITAEEVAQNEFVNYVVRGEGEETLYQLLMALDSGRPPEDVASLTFKKQNKIVNTADANFIDLNSIPPIPYYLLKNLQAYSELKREPSIGSIGTSRGCPHNCGFCYNKAVHRRKWRAMSPGRVILEIKNILKYFQPGIIIANDDYFFASIPRAKEIAQRIIDEKLNIKWSGSMRFDSAARLEDDFWTLLKRSGFVNPNFGGESGSTEILKLIDKKISLGQMEDVVSRLSKYNFIVYANYMLGLPGEKYSDIIETFAFMKKLSAQNNNFFTGLSIYTPYPGTPLYPMALKYGLKAPKRLEDWADYQYNSVSNLPWLRGRARSVARTTGLFTHFSFNQRLNIKYNIPYKNPIFLIAFFILSLSARIRWVLNFFIFPIEWRIYEYVCRAFKISER